MKKFATPLIVNGTHQQIKDLIPEFIKLGYTNIGSSFNYDDKVLVTNLNPRSNPNSNQIEFDVDEKGYVGIVVSASNKDLVLALAGMTEGEELHEGNFCWWSGNEQMFLTLTGGTNSLSVWESDAKTHSSLSKRYLRKATVEEILKHFGMIDIGDRWIKAPSYAQIKEEVMGSIINTNMEETREIIGYKVREGLDKDAIGKLIGSTLVTGCIIDFCHESATYRNAKELGILHFFNIIYKEKKIIKVEYEKKGKFLEVEIKPKGILSPRAHVRHNDFSYYFSQQDLEKIVRPIHLSDIKCRPSYVTIGCNDQFKNVKVEDIQKVIDALN